MKLKVTSLFFILSLVFAVSSIQFGGALSQVRMDRTASAQVAYDNGALLKLEGFQNKSYNIKKKYTSFGSVTNNMNQVMRLNITITPRFTNGKNGSFGIKIGTEAVEFNSNSTTPKQLVLTLTPGQVLDAQAYVDNSLVSATASFQFSATNDAGTYLLQFGDTADSPRRITIY